MVLRQSMDTMIINIVENDTIAIYGKTLPQKLGKEERHLTRPTKSLTRSAKANIQIHYQEKVGKKTSENTLPRTRRQKTTEKYITKNTEKKDKLPKTRGQKKKQRKNTLPRTRGHKPTEIHYQEHEGKNQQKIHYQKHTKNNSNREIHYQEHEGWNGGDGVHVNERQGLRKVPLPRSHEEEARAGEDAAVETPEGGEGDEDGHDPVQHSKGSAGKGLWVVL